MIRQVLKYFYLPGLFSFFITCAFSSPPIEGTATTLQYVNRISMWVVKSTLVIDSIFLLFFIYSVVRSEIDWLKAGTHVWTARQLIILQVRMIRHRQKDRR